MNSSGVTFRVVFWSYFLNDRFITNNKYDNIDLVFSVASHLARPPVSVKLRINTLSPGSSVVRHGCLVFPLMKSFIFLSLVC